MSCSSKNWQHLFILFLSKKRWPTHNYKVDPEALDLVSTGESYKCLTLDFFLPNIWPILRFVYSNLTEICKRNRRRKLVWIKCSAHLKLFSKFHPYFFPEAHGHILWFWEIYENTVLWVLPFTGHLLSVDPNLSKFYVLSPAFILFYMNS